MPYWKNKQSEIFDQSILQHPKTLRQFNSYERINPDGDDKPISRAAPGILAKWGWDHAEEVRALKFLSGKLSIPIPRVFLHAPFPRTFVNPVDWGSRGVWYSYMEECPGVPLHDVVDTMTTEELDHVADQLATALTEMRSIKSRIIGSVSGGPFNNRYMPYPWNPKHAFESVGEYLSYYHDTCLDFCGAEYLNELFGRPPRNGPIVFTHGDILPCNTIVQGSKITGLIDWETSGFYPEFFEYCRMHSPLSMTPGWDYILKCVFPGPRRQQEIDTLRSLMSLVHHNRIFDVAGSSTQLLFNSTCLPAARTY